MSQKRNIISKKDKRITEAAALAEMRRLGAMPAGIKIMRDKTKFRLLRLAAIRTPLATIIKESMLSAGGDAAVHKLTCTGRVLETDILLMGTLTQYKHLLQRLQLQPFSAKKIAARIKQLLK